MANVLKAAFSGIKTLLQQKQIVIKRYKLTNSYGKIINTLQKKENAYAQVMQASPAEVQAITGGTLDSIKILKFFFSDKDADILKSYDVDVKLDVIEYQGRDYKLYAIRDWRDNGWLCLYGAVDLGGQSDK